MTADLSAIPGYDPDSPYSLKSDMALQNEAQRQQSNLWAIIGGDLPDAEKSAAILRHFAGLPREIQNYLNARQWIDQADIFARLASVR